MGQEGQLPSFEPTPDAAHAARREEIRLAYDRLIERAARTREEIEGHKLVVPNYGVMWSYTQPIVIWAHSLLGGLVLGEGDWYFDELAAQDLRTWRKVHAVWLLMSSYLQTMVRLGGNEETIAMLASPQRAEEVRQAHLRAFQEARASLVHDHGMGGLDGEDLRRALAGGSASISVTDYYALLQQRGVRLQGALPVYGGGSNYAIEGQNMAWRGQAGQNYLKDVREQELAAARMAQISNYILFALQSVRSSWNDLMAGLQGLVAGMLMIVIAILVAILPIRVWFLAAVAWLGTAAATTVIVGTIAGPLMGVGAAVRTAIDALLKIKLLAVIAWISQQLSSIYTNYTTLAKNKSTINPVIERYRGQLRDWMDKTAALPHRRWPNPLGNVQFPGMHRDASGRWVVASSGAERNLTTPDQVLGYQGARTFIVDGQGVSWPSMSRPDPPPPSQPKPDLPPDP